MVEKHHTSGFLPSIYDPFKQLGERVANWLAPAAEAAGSEDAYHINVELPGVAEDDIHLSVENGVVILKGEKRTEREEKGETWYFSERQYGSFSRSFKLPPDANSEAVDAQLTDGVLHIVIPKVAPKASNPAKVEIRKG